MQDFKKIFSSDLRKDNPTKNNLFDLLQVIPAIPTTPNTEKETTCDFEPKSDKHFVPKKQKKYKVKTVRDIRNEFEKDVYSYLTNDLDKQQSVLLKKFTGGSAKDETTKELAINLLKCDKPVTRSAWQMLTNLNPEGHNNCVQYVLWNGRRIRVNGSKGGKTKFICNYDLTKKKISKNTSFLKKKTSNKKQGMLRNSLTVKFKPGPLTKKIHLDDSYQKYNVGDTELISLPKPGLDIQPTYGVVLDSTVTNFLQNLRDENGTISEKWAEFAVSVLGTLKNAEPIQTNKECCVTFDLNYKYDQSRLLMRRDVNKKEMTDTHSVLSRPYPATNESEIISEVTTIISNILDYVEINLQQDCMYSLEVEPREIINDVAVTLDSNTRTKDKVRKKQVNKNELNRLDVTIIRLPEAPQEDNLEVCKKSHCTLGCICASLRCPYNLKQHCSRIDCMFECTCDFSKYNITDSFESDCPDLIPGLLSLDNEINLKLSKEEQKFHQTVVMTGEKSILLKSERRNWKASKRYADFYSNMHLKTKKKLKEELAVVDIKLNCTNIEPWCMVHNLYKCFCKGQFTEKSASCKVFDEADLNETIPKPTYQDEISDIDVSVNKNTVKKNKEIEKSSLEISLKQYSCSESSDATDLDAYLYDGSTCARIKPYKGRKYYDSYYKNTNKKILELEKNDDKLHKKMINLINRVENIEIDKNINNDSQGDDSHSENDQDIQTDSSESVTIQNNSDQETSVIAKNNNNVHDRSILNSVTKAATKSLPNKSKLIAWLESSYKQYKQRIDRGIFKTSLDPPRQGKVALYPWDFVLSRYKERKNLFLISKQRPFRIFMAVDSKNHFFDNCINIDDIRFVDLNKYPITVKNLLTNATDLKDNFCILCGLIHCWELIGSVTKVKEQKDSEAESSRHTLPENTPTFKETNISFDWPENTATVKETTKRSYDLNDNTTTVKEKRNRSCEGGKVDVHETKENSVESEGNLESSKWFVMTVENDFSEIQFYKRGFFVKYESIIKAINVARFSEKTVRLSSQKCADQSTGPQFGIYAIPNANEYCVFVGPYDKEESLGIETVKSISDVGKTKRTRGVWITTRKVDNVNVIDNPLSFMPPTNLHPSKVVSLEGDVTTNTLNENMTEHEEKFAKTTDVKETPKSAASPKEVKIVKPIKIRKTNGFYHLASISKRLLKTTNTTPTASNEILKQIYSQDPQYLKNQNQVAVNAKPLMLNKTLLKKNIANMKSPLLNITSNIVSSTRLFKKNPSKSCETSQQHCIRQMDNKRPVAEIAPQIKIVGIYSESGSALNFDNAEIKKPEGGMIILKPEQINERVNKIKNMDRRNAIPILQNSNKTDINFSQDLEINQDIENFLATSNVCSPPNADGYAMSDDDRDCYDDVSNLTNLKQVWIECRNIEDLGWIQGKKNTDNNSLSFEFPGFKYTEFYAEEDAFCKINQVLSRKIYVPQSVTLEWHVTESENELKTKHKLQADELGIDFVLTKRGLRHKRDLIANSTSDPRRRKKISADDVDKASDLLSKLEDTSKILEDESNLLLTEITKRREIFETLTSVSTNQQREQVAERLQTILLTESMQSTGEKKY